MKPAPSFPCNAGRTALASLKIPTLAAVAVMATSGVAQATFDRFVVIQPIVVCDNAGNNCAPVDTDWAATARTYEQAGVLPIILPLSQFNNTALLNTNNGPSSFVDANGGSANALTINVWFTASASIVNCGGPGANIVGCGSTPGKRIVLDIARGGVTGPNFYSNLLPHEMGHNFGLPHVAVTDTTNLMNPFVGSGTYDQIGVSGFVLNAGQVTTIRADAKAQTAANCNGDGGVNLITLNAGNACLNVFAQGNNDVITLNAGSGVLQDVQGQDGNDTIVIQNGAIVGANVSGGNNNDAITIAGLVLLNVAGDAGDDTIDVQATAQIIGNVDGGSGQDTITVAADPANIFGGIGSDSITLLSGGVVTNSIFGDDGNGNEADGDAADTILIAGGSVGVSVFGEGGDDRITMTSGSIGDDISGGGGADIIIMAGGSVGDDIVAGAGADTVVILGGTVTDGVFGEADADAITLAGGTIGGVISGGAGSDFIDVLLGSVAGIAGDGDNDRIRVLGGTVTGNVTGGTGNDTILLEEPGTILGFVDGGADTDTITIAADPTNVFGGIGTDIININTLALVTGNVFGDDGNGNEADGDAADLINLNGGNVGGFVSGEGGADIINLVGTTVAGNLFGGGGGDTFNVSGGSTNGIRGDAGDDIALWTGGTIATNILMGTGTDRLDVVGPNFGGSANQSGLTLLDGGDDASSADGQIDTLNLIGVRGPVAGTPTLLAPVQNWERIFVKTNSLLTLGGASRTISGELFQIDASSVVFATGVATFNFGGQLQNLGALDLRDGAANSIVDAAGQYFGGAGSTLFVNAQLGGPGSRSDELRAASTAGNTGISVVDVLGGAGAYNPDGVVVVRTDAGQSDATHFALNGGPIDKGLFVYDLLFADSTLTNVVTLGVAEDQHVLAGVPDIEAFQLGRVPAQAQWAWARSTGVWRDRTADLREYASGNEGLVKNGLAPGAWGRVYGANAERDDIAELTLLNKTYTYDTSYDLGIRGITAGADWVENGILDGTALFGAFVGYSSTESHFDVASGPASPPKVLGSGISVGAYATYLKNGLYVDTLIKADFPELKLTFGSLAPFGASDTVDARSIGGVLDVGYRTFYWRGVYAEALGTLSYASTRIDDALLGGSVIDFGSNDSLRGRLGAGLGGQIYEFKGNAITARFEGSAWHEFDADNATRILSLGPALTVNDDAGGTYGELSGQLNAFDMLGGPSSFVKFDYRFNGDYRDTGLSIGLRVPLGG